MIGAIPPLPNTPSWCGTQLKHRDNFTFTLETTELFLQQPVKSKGKEIYTPIYIKGTGTEWLKSSLKMLDVRIFSFNYLVHKHYITQSTNYLYNYTLITI
jgi:hypothetical protein